MLKTSSMISNAINKIDNFYYSAVSVAKSIHLKKQAAPPMVYNMPDDPEDDDEGEKESSDKFNYNKIMQLIMQISNPDIRSEAELILNLYKTSIHINGGYNLVIRAISNFLDVILDNDVDISDEEDDAQTDLKDQFNELSAFLSEKIASSANKIDSPEAIKAMREVKEQHATDTDSINKMIQEVAPVVVDRSGGTHTEKGDKGSGSGMGVVGPKPSKDWINSFTEERRRYAQELQRETNPKVIEKKKKIIEVLDQLILHYHREEPLYAKISTETNPSPALVTAYEAIKGKIAELKKERSSVRQSLRNHILSGETSKAQTEYSEIEKRVPTSIEEMEKDPTKLFNDANKKKYQLYQNLVLSKHLESKDKNKGAATLLRKALVAFLPTMAKSEDGIRKFKDLTRTLSEASKRIIPIQKVWEEQGEELKEIKSKGDFEGEFKQLQQHLPNIKMGDKKQVIDKWREQIILHANEQEKIKYGSFLMAIAAARASGIRANLTLAMGALYKELNDTVKQFADKMHIINNRMRALEEQYADVQKFRLAIENLAKNNNVFYKVKGGASTSIKMKDSLSEAEKPILLALINECSELAERSYPNPFTGAERLSTKPVLENLKTTMMSHLITLDRGSKSKIKEQVVKKPNPTIEQTDENTGEVTYLDPDTKESYYKDIGPNGEAIYKNVKEASLTKLILKQLNGEKLNKQQRKLALSKITNNLKFTKKAFVDTSASQDVSQIMNDSSLNSIEDDNEYAHQVFQKMLGQMNEKMKKMY